jgi:hypothetical protein
LGEEGGCYYYVGAPAGAGEHHRARETLAGVGDTGKRFLPYP